MTCLMQRAEEKSGERARGPEVGQEERVGKERDIQANEKREKQENDGEGELYLNDLDVREQRHCYAQPTDCPKGAFNETQPMT